MNFEKLNKLNFEAKNNENHHVCWDVDHTPTAPRLCYTNISEKEISILDPLLERAVYQTVLDYLNEEALCNADPDMFPCRSRLTGNYYIAEKCCVKQENRFHGSVLTHFTELFTGGVIVAPIEQDYLALEIYFSFQNGEVEITGIDSASI
ncbi:hypothetical protein CHU32_10040 [Superficieibacter electus]|uniref:DUF2262 domain-containing protein n=1 Tax=Superficieibacter electus TaxID=2022662 RepID=A0A2P5GQV2_9ENTR|nr:hypothetical protein [Superficieibacter electus]POP43409.1 hypothetical protein CHU33_16155 [Superficieibacter electus]POP48924.1 hypothetical protein CHU32_10040 [Superficieibacter electus]